MKDNKQNIKVAVDVVILTVAENALKAILIQMKKSPFKGVWAFPGGLINRKETVDAAAERELKEKTGMVNVYLEQLYTFGDIKRDPSGRVISVAYFALINSDLSSGGVKLETTAKYSNIKWVDVKKMPKLAYDHKKMTDYAIKRLRWKLEYTNIAYSLLPKQFPLSELRRIYEIILGKKIDKRNFQRKILSLNLLKKTKTKKTGKHRPAVLYEFKKRKPQIVEIV